MKPSTVVIETSPALKDVSPANEVVVAGITASAPNRSADEVQSASDKRLCDTGKVIFSCTTKNNRDLLVCDKKENIEYTFGKSAQTPALVLNLKRSLVTTSQYEGVGRYENYSVEVPNKDITYSVFWSLDKNSENKTTESGVSVIQNGKSIATVLCADKVINNMIQVNLKKSE